MDASIATDLRAPVKVASSAVSAVRCRECHEAIDDEWRTSAHSHAASAPLYVAAKKSAGKEGATCDHCHSPFASSAEPDDPVLTEGVTCDVCHTINAVEDKKSGGAFTLKTEDNIKYGTLCDAVPHYFHKMGCSPLHTEGKFCAGCHYYYRGEVPVFTEYEEWKNGPYSNQDCQSCHMPGTARLAASGGAVRPGIGMHDDFGANRELRRRALTGTVEITSDKSGVAHVVVDLVNERAGHFVPSGMPGRQLVLNVMTPAMSRHGEEVRFFDRVLVDAKGAPAPFWSAVSVAKDTRIAPKAKRTSTVELDAPVGSVIRVSVFWRSLALALDEFFGVVSHGNGFDEMLLEGEGVVPLPGQAPRRFTLRMARP